MNGPPPRLLLFSPCNIGWRYARRDCGDQPDQELFSIISSEKMLSPLPPNEKGVILSPIRMKPDHPSTTLPTTARIYFQRTYRIDDLDVQPLRLVHSASIETLLDQFETNALKLQPGRHSEEPDIK